MAKKDNFAPYFFVYERNTENKNKKVESIDLSIVANDYQGNFNVTDIQLQEGDRKTHYHPNTKEFLGNIDFELDEFAFLKTVSNPVKEGVQPRHLKGIKNRIFNVMGRGHDVIALPNIQDNDYTKDLVSTYLDLTIVPKNDYDLLRISTNEGSFMGEAYQDDEKHPLNIRYTKEFFFKGGRKGDEIKLTASKYKATVNGINIPITKKSKISEHLDMVNVQRFMTAHFGEQRIRIEFYKISDKINDYGEIEKKYEDTGIGYNVFAEFKQYEKGAIY